MRNCFIIKVLSNLLIQQEVKRKDNRMMNENELNAIVKECLLQHEGGEKFFDELDYRIRESITLLRGIMSKVIFSEESFDYIIVSGKFGYVFKEFAEREYPLFNVISINGSLRKGTVNEEFKGKDYEGKRFVFIDDSFYSGTTMNKVKEYIESCHGIFVSTFVFYDGSKEKREDVHSIYRYYD